LKAALQLFALPGLPMVQAGDDLAGLLSAAMARAGLKPQSGDVLAVAQKIVSKAEAISRSARTCNANRQGCASGGADPF
jgi:coenzyme F420-0:L-glutamate ligase/coenzyme F420-1:gamma-L-glutamate ligase